MNLSTEDAKLLEDLYESFKANGATLNKDDKEKYRKLSMDLSMLTLQFDQNALKDKKPVRITNNGRERTIRLTRKCS